MTIAIVAMGAYAGLIPATNWGTDEVHVFALLDEGGFSFFVKRLLEWSPRPVSDGLLWLYQIAVAATGRQSIVPFLALIWSTLPLSAVAALGPRTSAAWLVAATTVALFLLGHPVGEVFYWPMGAGAYVPCLAGMTYVTLRLGRMPTVGTAGELACMVALLIAAGSSEIGIVFTLVLCPLLIALARPVRLVRLWCVVPLVASLVLAGLLATGRMAQGIERSSGPSITFHRPWASLVAAATRLGAEALSVTAGQQAPTLERLDRLLFLVGVALCLQRAGIVAGSPARLAAIALALGMAAYASLASAYFHFGTLCCERHSTMRSCLLVLLLFTGALALSRLRVLERLPRSISGLAGPGLLAAALAMPLAGAGRALLADYRAMPGRIAARDATWREGVDPTATAMVYRVLPLGRVVEGFGAPTGHADRATAGQGFALDVMMYFQKSAIDVLALP